MEEDNSKVAEEIFNKMEEEKMNPTQEEPVKVAEENNLMQFSVEGKRKKELWQHIRKLANAKRDITAQIKELQKERAKLGEFSKSIKAVAMAKKE